MSLLCFCFGFVFLFFLFLFFFFWLENFYSQVVEFGLREMCLVLTHPGPFFFVSSKLTTTLTQPICLGPSYKLPNIVSLGPSKGALHRVCCIFVLNLSKLVFYSLKRNMCQMVMLVVFCISLHFTLYCCSILFLQRLSLRPAYTHPPSTI